MVCLRECILGRVCECIRVIALRCMHKGLCIRVCASGGILLGSVLGRVH